MFTQCENPSVISHCTAVLIGTHEENKEARAYVKTAGHSSSLVPCVLPARSPVHTEVRVAHTPAMVPLCGSLSNFLSRFSKYCYFNSFRRVRSCLLCPPSHRRSGELSECICSASNADDRVPFHPHHQRTRQMSVGSVDFHWKRRGEFLPSPDEEAAVCNRTRCRVS